MSGARPAGAAGPVEERLPRSSALRRGTVIVLGAAFGILWLGGVATYAAADAPPEGLRWTAPVFLALALALAMASAQPKARGAILLAGAIGWAAEVIGLHTGWPFGAYAYGDALGPKPLGAPLAIGAAWGVLAAAACGFARARWQGWRALAAAAAWLVAADLSIDPVASSRLGFWTWEGEGAFFGVPAMNFGGWFVVGLLASAPLVRRSPTSGPAWVGLSLVIFFAAVSLLSGLWLPAAIGAALVALHLLVARRPDGAAGGAA